MQMNNEHTKQTGDERMERVIELVRSCDWRMLSKSARDTYAPTRNNQERMGFASLLSALDRNYAQGT